MFTLFSGRHIAKHLWCTYMAFSYWALQISAKHFDEYLKFGETHKSKVCKTAKKTVFIFYNVTLYWLFPLHGFRFKFYSVTVKTIVNKSCNASTIRTSRQTA